jgi:hypothetical protein
MEFTRSYHKTKNTNSHFSRGSYQYVDISEGIQTLYDQILSLTNQVALLNQQVSELMLHRVEMHQKDYLTIKEVAKLFDFSPRLQQEERSAGKLGYIKKNDGGKVLYHKDHIGDYISKYFSSPPLRKKDSC